MIKKLKYEISLYTRDELEKALFYIFWIGLFYGFLDIVFLLIILL